VNRGIADRLVELRADRIPFVRATVVRAQVPASAHAGDTAIVFGDGTIEGFVGGQCAETSVRTAALTALRDDETMLLRVLPDEQTGFPDLPGALVVVNTCLSGGALEIFLEPILPSPLVEVVGATPVADAIVAMADLLGYATGRSVVGVVSPEVTAVVVASHGRDENVSIRAALDAGVPYIALVASRRRGRAVLDELGLTADERARVSTPAGLDIGARTAPEVALSILAEVITAVRRPAHPGPARTSDPAPRIAVDPVCGMTVTVMPDTPQHRVEDVTFWFCSAGCRATYAQISES
jgi:xanthine dehydrogenase accessory factor